MIAYKPTKKRKKVTKEAASLLLREYNGGENNCDTKSLIKKVEYVKIYSKAFINTLLHEK